MAPEQIRSARDVDRRADVWALGVILHELVSGLPPFRGDTLAELCDCILERCAAPLRAPDRPLPELEGALAGCFAKDPSDRYQDVRAFAEAIVRFGSADARASFDRIVRMTEGRTATVIRNVSTPSIDPTLGSDRGAAPENVVSRSGVRSKSRPARRAAWPAAIVVSAAALVAAGVYVAPRLARRAAQADAPTVTGAPASEPLVIARDPLPVTATVARAVAADAIDAAPRSAPPAPSPKAHPRVSPPRATAPSAAPAAPIASAAPPTAPPPAGARPDPLGLDTGSLFMDRR
jgi:serine/threonine-protein kinase